MPDHQRMEKVVQPRLDNQLVLAVHFQVVRNSTEMLQVAVRRGQHKPRCVAVPFARRDQRVERGYPGRNVCQLLFAGARIRQQGLACIVGRGQPGLAVHPLVADLVEHGAHARNNRRVLLAPRGKFRRFDLQVGGLRSEADDLGIDAVTRLGGVLHHILQHRRRTHGCKFGAAHRFDVNLDTFDRRLRFLVRRLGGPHVFGGGLPIAGAAPGCLDLRGKLLLQWRPPRLERRAICFERGGC